MSQNEKVKGAVTAFLIKALPWAIVFVAGYVLGFLTGAK